MGTGFKSVLIDNAQSSAFGTIETAELTPVVQMDFVYGINTQTGSSTVSGTGATVDTNGGRLRVQSGTASGGYAYFISKRPIRYRPGQGVTARFTAIFTTGVANNVQFAGAGTVVSNAVHDGYGFGYNGTSYGILYYNAGSLTFTAQASWNVNPSPFTIVPTNGNVYMIKYPFLGYGDIEFFIQNPDNGNWALVHIIKYANSSTTIQISNPALHALCLTRNAAVVTNCIIYAGSFGAFVSGTRSFAVTPTWAYDNNKSSITTETNIISLRNATTYNTVTNRAIIRLTGISFGSSAASGICNIRLKTGVTLGGAPSYATINGTTADNGVTITSGNSVASVDVAGTTVTGGIMLFSISAENPGGQFIDLTPYDIFVSAGETLTVSGFSSSTSTITVSINWTEDI